MNYDKIIEYYDKFRKYIIVIIELLIFIVSVIIPLQVYIRYEEVFVAYSLAINGMIIGRVFLLIFILYSCSSFLNKLNKYNNKSDNR